MRNKVKELYIIPLSIPQNTALEQLKQAIAQTFSIETQITPSSLNLSFAFDPSRDQYNSTYILAKLLEVSPKGTVKILGVTDVDLFIPILTFVFGEAQLDGLAAVVSMYRLNNELYGLPRDEEVLRHRLIKEAIHELGHTFGVRHCSDYECVMRASTYAEEIDLKSEFFCTSCRKLIK